MTPQLRGRECRRGWIQLTALCSTAWALFKAKCVGVPVAAQRLTNPVSIHEWVKDPALPRPMVQVEAQLGSGAAVAVA